jgi:Na+/proline symporter
MANISQTERCQADAGDHSSGKHHLHTVVNCAVAAATLLWAGTVLGVL